MSDDRHDSEAAREAEAYALLERSLARVTPPVDLFDRILAEVRPEATVIPLRRSTRRRLAVPVTALASAAAVAVLAVAVTRGGPGAADARAANAGKSDSAVTGEAVLYHSQTAGGTVHVSLSHVPPPPSGHHYEVWVLRRNAGSAMEAVGAFTPASSTVSLDLPLPGPGTYAAVDVSVQKNGGSPLHGTTSLAGGAFS